MEETLHIVEDKTGGIRPLFRDQCAVRGQLLIATANNGGGAPANVAWTATGINVDPGEYVLVVDGSVADFTTLSTLSVNSEPQTFTDLPSPAVVRGERNAKYILWPNKSSSAVTVSGTVNALAAGKTVYLTAVPVGQWAGIES